MPNLPPRPCTRARCRKMAVSDGRCADHQRKPKPKKQPDKRGSGSSRGYNWVWSRLRQRIMARDRYLCQCDSCKHNGTIKVAHEVDHIKPKAWGGTDDPSNLRAINKDCHKIKTQREISMGRWRAAMRRQLQS